MALVLALPPQRDTEETLSRPPAYISSLVAHVRGCWEEAKTAKAPIEQRMLRNIRMFRSEYDPEKLAAIKAMRGSEIFIPIVNMKCRAGEAWLREVLFPPKEIPWDIQPSPIPDLPESVKAEILAKLQATFDSLVQMEIMQAQQPGMPLDMEAIQQKVLDSADELKEQYEKEIMAEAKRGAEKMKTKINDQFTEGGFYKAMDECVYDITIFPTAILKGPIFRKVKKMKKEFDESIRMWVTYSEDVITEHYERCNPLDIFPAPESGGVNDGYLFHRTRISARDLYNLINVDGFNAEEIRAVLREGPKREFISSDDARKRAENKYAGMGSSQYSEIYDMLEYWGPIKGKDLLSWGVQSETITDPFQSYEAAAWVIGNHCIKAILNPDPIGGKPFSRASFVEIPNSFWGMSIPDVLSDIQGACNAIARAIVNNAAIGSGPLVERNIDRLPQYEKDSTALYPWKMFDATETQIGSAAPAFRFYQPPMVVDKLLMVFSSFLKQSDELSGIPAYAHGDVSVGGAGRTASGLKILTGNASRGIKAVVRNIDKGLIEPTIERQYYLNLSMNVIDEPLPDLQCIAKGSYYLEEKEADVIRKAEFLNTTNNPIDQQITGMGGRAYLLEQVAKANGFDVEKAITGLREREQQMAMAAMQAQVAQQQGGATPATQPSPLEGGSPPAPQMVNPAGQSMNGQEVRQFNGENGR